MDNWIEFLDTTCSLQLFSFPSSIYAWQIQTRFNNCSTLNKRPAFILNAGLLNSSEKPGSISSINFMVDSSIHFKVVPTKFIPLLQLIQLWSVTWLIIYRPTHSSAKNANASPAMEHDRILPPCKHCHHPWCVGDKSDHKALLIMFICNGMSDHAG